MAQIPIIHTDIFILARARGKEINALPLGHAASRVYRHMLFLQPLPKHPSLHQKAADSLPHQTDEE